VIYNRLIRNSKSKIQNPSFPAEQILYVQRPKKWLTPKAETLFDTRNCEQSKKRRFGRNRRVRHGHGFARLAGFRALFPQLRKHLKLVSSTPIRNMATLAGNFVNASPSAI
jgi:xanthine dehydrogenase small subunit